MIKSVVSRLHRLPDRTRSILTTCAYGLSAGVITVAFQSGINWVYNGTFVRFSKGSVTEFLTGSFVTIIVASLAVGWLLNRFCPAASGSGIPQHKLAFWKDFGYVPFRVVWVKFLAGIASIGGGCSLGREGPSVQFGGGFASNLAGWTGEAKQQRRTASAAGAAAGLAAAFNTPLAATTFVLEEIIGDLNSLMLGSVLLAAVIGALVVHGLIGSQPAFTLQPVTAPTWKAYLFTPLVAAMAAIIGGTFQKCTMRLRAARKEFRHVPSWLRPTLGGIATWVIGSAVFLTTGHLGVFGLGYGDLSSALGNDLPWKIAALLLFSKLAATVLCYGFGGCGGIFSPALCMGGMCGAALADGFDWAFHLNGPDQTVLAVVGMTACLGAVVRAPVTSLLIVFEMTHEFSLVPALMVGALVSQAISRRMNRHNFYDELLVQDGHILEHVIPPRDLQSWQQLPVSAIANFHPVLITDLDEAALAKTLKEHPHERFPVVQNEKLAGTLTRVEVERALREKRPPKILTATTCLAKETIRDLQVKLIESTTLMVVVLDKPEGKVLGVVTLHDLLRAEVSFAQNNK